MEGGARDARRRRIIERGSDRLAFITGEVRTLPTSPPPPSPPPPPPKQEDPSPTVASLSENDAIVENDDREEQPDGETTEEFPKCKLGKEFPGRGRSNEAPSNVQTSDGSTELFTPSVARESSDQVTETSIRTAPQMTRHIFTPSQINRAIAATEKIRILCAVTIALLVVISDHGYSLGGNVVRSLINFRPMFLVLLTDAAILLGWLLVVVGSNGKAEDEARRTDQEEKGLADNVGMALEVGLVIQKAFRAAVMNCSICVVIMISGL